MRREHALMSDVVHVAGVSVALQCSGLQAFQAPVSQY